MSTPVATFTKSIAGLSVTFTDTSSNLPVSWLWNFGDGTTGNAQNPTHTYTSPGKYTVVLTATNSDGSNTVVTEVMVSDKLILSKTIAEMVKCDIPTGIEVDTSCFNHSIQKWQLYLQPLVNSPEGPIDSNVVFDETAWPPLVNILISLLIINDQILNAAKAATIQLDNYKADSVSQSLQVCDYSVAFDHLAVFAGPSTITLTDFSIDGFNTTPNQPIPDAQALLTYLNGLGKGTFYYTNTDLVSVGNTHVLTKFTYTKNSISIDGSFSQANCRLENIVTTQVGGGTGSPEGNVKAIETGPSRVEWFDNGDYWYNIFRTSGADGGGVLKTFQTQICSMAARLRIQLPDCPKIAVRTPLFVVGGTRGGGGCRANGLWLTGPDYINLLIKNYNKDNPLTFTDQNIQFQQGIPSQTWVINHNFAFQPTINVYDTNGSQIVQYTRTDSSDSNTTILTFGIPTSGKVILS